MYTSSILQIFIGISICFSLVLRNMDDFMVLRGWWFVPWNLKNIKNDSSPFSLLSSVLTYKHIQYIIISFKIIASLSKIEEIIIILQNMKSYPHPPFLYKTIPTYILTYPTFLVTQRKFRFISQIYLFLFFSLIFRIWVKYTFPYIRANYDGKYERKTSKCNFPPSVCCWCCCWMSTHTEWKVFQLIKVNLWFM